MVKKHKNYQLNVFDGENAMQQFLNPDENPFIPLVEIPEACNPFAKQNVKIYAKLMHLLPLGNVKSLPALSMLLKAKNTGSLEKVHSLIENSSGNTVMSLTVLASYFGIQKTHAFVSHEVSWGKLQMLRLFGTNITVNKEPICPDPQDTESGIYKAKQQGKKEGWFNPGQYDNPANPESHEQWTGPQIWQQTQGKISLFCAGLGTTGTLVGTSRYLRKKNKNISVIGVTRSPNNPVPGVRTKNLLREIAFDWESQSQYLMEIGTNEAFHHSLQMIRCGLLVGPSSGFALAGLLSFLKKNQNNLDAFRNKEGNIIAVFICPDSPLPYIEDYFSVLPESSFPVIEKKELLIHNKTALQSSHKNDAKFDISPTQALEELYHKDADSLWSDIQQEKAIFLQPHILLLDIRSQDEFHHFHLPQAVHIDLYKLNPPEPALLKKMHKKTVFLLCSFGLKTAYLAHELQTLGIKAFSIHGGATEWSKQNLPRVRPSICSRKK